MIPGISKAFTGFSQTVNFMGSTVGKAIWCAPKPLNGIQGKMFLHSSAKSSLSEKLKFKILKPTVLRGLCFGGFVSSGVALGSFLMEKMKDKAFEGASPEEIRELKAKGYKAMPLYAEKKRSER